MRKYCPEVRLSLDTTLDINTPCDNSPPDLSQTGLAVTVAVPCQNRSAVWRVCISLGNTYLKPSKNLISWVLLILSSDSCNLTQSWFWFPLWLVLACVVYVWKEIDALLSNCFLPQHDFDFKFDLFWLVLFISELPGNRCLALQLLFAPTWLLWAFGSFAQDSNHLKGLFFTTTPANIHEEKKGTRMYVTMLIMRTLMHWSAVHSCWGSQHEVILQAPHTHQSHSDWDLKHLSEVQYI